MTRCVSAPPSAREELYGRDEGTGASSERRNIDGYRIRKPLPDPRPVTAGGADKLVRLTARWNKTGKAVNSLVT
jgi:hypothetical protein